MLNIPTAGDPTDWDAVIQLSKNSHIATFNLLQPFNMRVNH